MVAEGDAFRRTTIFEGSSQRGAALARECENTPDSVEGKRKNADGENSGAFEWEEKMLVDFSTFAQEQN
jgi:hypothetical protein